MPLDTGAFADAPASPPATSGAERGPAPTLSSRDPLGEVLRAARLHSGLDLDELSRITRVRTNYLIAIEQMRLDLLPSRPFALGFVRAYASALGLDPDLAAARLKAETPDGPQQLKAPVGVRRESDPRMKILVAAGTVVVAAIASWNIAQHVLTSKPPPTRGMPEVAASAAKPPSGPSGPLALGAPLPAPAESTTPQPYVTPGLEQQIGPVAQAAAAQSAAAAAQPEPVGSPFAQKGAIYGAAAGQSNVIVQARKSATLVVRGSDGSVYFARQLAAGEAYRAPDMKGVVIDVSDPTKFDVYVAGLLKGPLTAAQTAASQLASQTAP